MDAQTQTITQLVSVTFDASGGDWYFGGAAGPLGVINVGMGATTKLVIALFTVNGIPGVPPAILTGLVFSEPPPPYISASEPGPVLGLGESSPTWLVTDAYLDSAQTGSTGFRLIIEYNGVILSHDPTIVNTDPGGVLVGAAAMLREAQRTEAVAV
jgi:hypothetical protein